jgi:EAL and modified HD-GYP domain-containing signal transduction protein
MAFRGEVHSVRQALALMGENEIRRWCRLAGMFEMSEDRPSELLLSALIRARFAESLGAHIEHGSADLFLLGLLSMMDAILEIPMSAILEGLALDDDSARLLLEHDGTLKPIHDLVVAVESGIWPSVVRSCRAIGIQESVAAQCYSNAIAWAQSLLALT